MSLKNEVLSVSEATLCSVDAVLVHLLLGTVPVQAVVFIQV